MLRLIHRVAISALLLCLLSCKKETPPVAFPEPQVRNLLLITIDTLRADALPAYGGKTPLPFIDSFAKQAAIFDPAFTSAPITLPAHVSLMSGLYPPAHEVRNNGNFRAPDSLKLLAEHAKNQGMATGAVIGGYPLAAQFGLNQGFDFYDDSFAQQPAAPPGVFLYTEKSAEQVRLSAESWISRVHSPYFLWLHFFDPHHPYLDHGRSGLQPYHQEIAYVDEQLAQFFDFLNARKLDERTLILITSDHGEAFGEHGEVSHTLFVYNTTVRIPLLMAGPGIPAGRHTGLARIIDILPTVQEAFGWKPEPGIDGASLWPMMRGATEPPRENYAETFAPALDFGWSPLASLQDLQYKYIHAPRSEFYDLRADPGENNSLSSPRSQSYRTKIEALHRRPSQQSAAGHTPTAEERERLASLGYTGGGNRTVDWNAADPKDRIATANQIAELAASPEPLAQKARAYAAIAKAEPSNPLLLLRYGEVLLKLKRHGEAEKTFQRVLDLDYSSAAAYNGLATALYYQQKPDAAERVLMRAVQTGAADGETHHNLAEFLFNHGDRQGAMREYDRSIALGYAPAFFRKARLLEVMAEHDRALEVLRAAEARFPSDMQVNFDRGMILFRRRQFAPAAEEFEKALMKAPQETSVYFNLGLSHLHLGNTDAARRNLERFIREAPPSMARQKAEARALLKKN